MTKSPTLSEPDTNPPDDSPLEYPLRFPIKVMGLADDAFLIAIIALVQAHDASFTTEHVSQRQSSSGKYLSLTVSPWIESRAQLDALYRALSSHPLVKYAL